MKKLLLILFSLSVAFTTVMAQTNIFYTKGLSSEDKTLVNKAKTDIDRANRLYNNSQKIYNQYKKLLENKHKSKRKKGEKKSLNGKLMLKQAAFYYDKGYQQLFEVYFNYVGSLNFQLSQNKQKALKLRSDAEDLFNQGQKIMKSLQNYSEKELKTIKVPFKKMFDNVDQGKDKLNQSIQLLLQAIDLFNNETAQIQQMRKKDDEAWQNALNENTIDAYQNYIASFPDGRHVSEAQAKIQELKNKPKEQDTTVIYTQGAAVGNLIYRVQIMAAKRPWTDNEIRQKVYPLFGMDGNPTFNAMFDGWYKYYIGQFSDYQTAKAFATNLRKTVKTKPFVVAFLNGQPIDIQQAINLEKSMKNK